MTGPGAGSKRTLLNSGVPVVVVATLGVFGFVGLAGLSFAGTDEPVISSVDGVARPFPDDPNFEPAQEVSEFAPTPLRLTLPAMPFVVRSSPDTDVRVEGDVCGVEQVSWTDERRDVEILCADPFGTRLVYVTVPSETPLTIVGGTRLTVAGDHPSLAINGSTADVALDDVSADALAVATSGEVTGRIRAASKVDVLSRNGRVDLTFFTVVRSTTIQAPRGEVAVQVARGIYDLELRAGKGGVSSALPDSMGAKDRLAITTNDHPITVTTTQ